MRHWNSEPEAWECADCGEIFNTAEEADACWNATNWPEDVQFNMRYGQTETKDFWMMIEMAKPEP